MRYDFDIPLTFQHRVVFERDVFGDESEVLAELLTEPSGRISRVFVFVEEGLKEAFPDLSKKVAAKLARIPSLEDRGGMQLPGGEPCKVDDRVYQKACDAIAAAGIDRHSYVFVIGGGAFLDAIGFAAATVHRGVRLVRFPTTTLSQDDSGVGVKSGINKYGKKNFMGAFAVPYAVVNDFAFLHTQSEEVRLDGLVEAVKVALVKDGSFFNWIEDHLPELVALEKPALEEAVERSAVLHATHIAEGGDPFESGSSRPLDFGHWAAHKLEQISDFQLSHARAVSVGLALDCLYSVKKQLLSPEDGERILQTLERMGLPVWSDFFDARQADGRREVFAGLEEFREHLGGQLTILLLRQPGEGIEVHEMDEGVLEDCIAELRERACALV
ncbi:3-dehydroquinate synthase [Roseibacillus persicicus]|uniref:3-dehydroquinate synthase n=1 Tax=Roseibacillus persicicus TaxID=454148 RepID=A0A918TUA0_9BACT|nr:3-dehydroquinate synthase [Roseibacillus persicicus]GHC63794.1 3-dehydroquinate synthase [Roseibacillus persicicus]